MSKKDNLVENKSYAFTLRIIKLYKFLVSDSREYVLSKQILRSGTSIGAMVKEAEHAQSKADFINKMSIALKEANETEYWLMLLKDSDYITKTSYNSIHPEISELIKLLASIEVFYFELSIFNCRSFPFSTFHFQLVTFSI